MYQTLVYGCGPYCLSIIVVSGKVGLIEKKKLKGMTSISTAVVQNCIFTSSRGKHPHKSYSIGSVMDGF